MKEAILIDVVNPRHKGVTMEDVAKAIPRSGGDTLD